MKTVNRSFLRLSDLSFRGKLLSAFLLSGIIPLILVGTLCYTEVIGLLNRQTEFTLNAALQTAGNVVTKQVSVYDNLVQYIAHSQTVATVASKEYSSVFDKFSALHYDFDVFMNEAYVRHPEIKSITVYVERDDLFHGKELRPVTDLENEKWYNPGEQFYATTWRIDDEGNVCLLKQVPKPYIEYVKAYSEHFVCMRIAPEAFFSELKNIYSNYRIRVTNRDTVIYEAVEPAVLKEITDSKSWFTKETTRLKDEWRIVLETPVIIYKAPVHRIMLLLVAVLLAVLGIVVLLGSRMASSFSRCVSHLYQAMQEVRQGNLEIHIQGESTDELGKLSDYFQDTVDDLKRLVVQNLENQIQIRESQLAALQAQINPHFLYNALSVINSRAIMHEESEISEMALLLSTFYRTTLNKGRSQTTLEQEISNVKSYVRIQQILHDDAFDVVFQIDHSINSMSMPNLLLQPLVENAILHGVLPKRDRRGQLLVSVTKSGAYAVFSVMDNGVGIPAERIPMLTQTDSRGYGLKNVNERLKLAYGEQCSLAINSVPGQSTMITFIVPIGEKEEQT